MFMKILKFFRFLGEIFRFFFIEKKVVRISLVNFFYFFENIFFEEKNLKIFPKNPENFIKIPRKIFFGKVGKKSDIKIEAKFYCGSNGSTLSL